MLGPDEELRQTPSRLPSSSSSDPPPTYRFPTEFFYRRIYSCFVRRVLAFWFSTGGADLSFSIFPRILSIRCLSTSTGAGEWSQSKQYTSNYRNLLCLTASSPRLSPFPCSRKRDILPRASELCRRLVSLPVDLCRSESESEYDCNMTSRRHLISPQHGRPVCLGWHSPHILRS